MTPQAPHPTPGLFEPELMQAVRSRFHHVERCPVSGQPRIFLESGGGSLKLKAAIEASAEVAAWPDQEGRDNPASKRLSEIIAHGREDLHLMFGSAGAGADRGRIVCGETGTRLLYRFIRAVALSAPPGPVISSTLEHPASLDAARQWAARTGRRLIEVPFDVRTGTLTANHYAQAVTPDTRLATIIHTSMLTGFVCDLPAITAAIRRVAPDCFIVVDGIQHAPHGAMAVSRYGADAYVFSPYKVYSRLSLGFGWLNERLHAVPHEHMLGKEVADWELGSRDPGFFAAQSAVVDHMAWLGGHFDADADRGARVRTGAQAMARHEAALIGLLLDGDAEAPGLRTMPQVTVIGPSQAQGREGLVSFNVHGMASPDAVRALAERGIRVHARIADGYSGHILSALGLEDCLRVSLAHYNTPDEIRACLRAVNALRP